MGPEKRAQFLKALQLEVEKPPEPPPPPEKPPTPEPERKPRVEALGITCRHTKKNGDVGSLRFFPNKNQPKISSLRGQI